MTLGHEVSGEIQELGPSVADLVLGMRVAVDPSRPCRSCDYCRAGRSNLCRQMRFLGSAAVMPHVQGGFRQSLVVRADQCLTVVLRNYSSQTPISVPRALLLSSMA
jgi:L-idonate 5-dehydrogenase